MTFKPWLIFALLLFESAGSVASDPLALKCLHNFTAAMDGIASYEAILTKKEYASGADLRNDELIDVYQSRYATKMTYRNEGSTGIRNNGMIVDYDGSPKIRVTLGSAKGLGTIVNLGATAVIGQGIRFDDSAILQGEYFTVNRAGFFPLATMLKTQLPSLSEDDNKNRGLQIRSRPCNLKYERHTDKFTVIKLPAEKPISEVEDQYGTLAFFIQQNNLALFPNLHDLFVRSRETSIRVPQWFLDFDLDLDENTYLPSRLDFYYRSKLLATYSYKLQNIVKVK